MHRAYRMDAPTPKDTTPWFCQHLAELTDEWFFFLPTGSRIAWIMLKAHVKANAFSQKQPSRAYRIPPATSAYQWRVSREDVEVMESSAINAGKLLIEDGVWEVRDRLIFQSARTTERFVRQTPTNAAKRSQIRPETETETETVNTPPTPSKSQHPKIPIIFPGVLKTECFFKSWEDWLAYRRQEGYPVGAITLQGQLSVLSKQSDPCACIKHSIESGYKAIVAPKESKPSASEMPKTVLREAKDLPPVT